MDTHFAPAARTDRRQLKNQIGDISHNLVMNSLLETVNGLLVVLNEDRQVVALNHAFLDSLGIQDPQKALGLRLGENLHCIHAGEQPSGCGTTPHCRTCGAAIATMTAIADNITSEQICALTTEEDGVTEDICLQIKAQPITIDTNRWILLYAQDITQQQFWATLERVFFHDINNILNSIMGYSDLLELKTPGLHEVQQIQHSTTRLVSEIALQRSLSQRKDIKYTARKEKISLYTIQQEVDVIVGGHSSSKNKTLSQKWPSEEVMLVTNSMLVSRILANMTINALEATDAHGTVKLTTHTTKDSVTWNITNKDFIPHDIQKRIFQRHFSTKTGLGRGLGTYSMKLFGETYLNGQVTFISTKQEGTIFTFTLPIFAEEDS